MPADQPEPWLRGPLPGIPPLLQPAAHAFVMAREDATSAVQGLAPEHLWRRPGGAASLGFHLAHLAGSTDRLLTYARGEALSDVHKEALAFERAIDETRPPLAQLIDRWHEAVDRALGQLASTPESALLEPRLVGRAQLPSTVLGLLFHAAEHASRHTGQIVTTATLAREVMPDQLIRGLRLQPHPEGGHFAELFRSETGVQPQDGRGERAAITTIYYLLAAGDISRWHRVRSDEVWHFYDGAPLDLWVLSADGAVLMTHRLGAIGDAARPTITVRAGDWQAARSTGRYSLAGCTVGPGFEFEDFTLLRDVPAMADAVRARHPEAAGFI